MNGQQVMNFNNFILDKKGNKKKYFISFILTGVNESSGILIK